MIHLQFCVRTTYQVCHMCVGLSLHPELAWVCLNQTQTPLVLFLNRRERHRCILGLFPVVTANFSVVIANYLVLLPWPGPCCHRRAFGHICHVQWSFSKSPPFSTHTERLVPDPPARPPPPRGGGVSSDCWLLCCFCLARM